MIFVCTEWIDGSPYGRYLDAESWDDAREQCSELGWAVNGVLEMTINAFTGEVRYDRTKAESAVTCLLERCAK